MPGLLDMFFFYLSCLVFFRSASLFSPCRLPAAVSVLVLGSRSPLVESPFALMLMLLCLFGLALLWIVFPIDPPIWDISASPRGHETLLHGLQTPLGNGVYCSGVLPVFWLSSVSMLVPHAASWSHTLLHGLRWPSLAMSCSRFCAYLQSPCVMRSYQRERVWFGMHMKDFHDETNWSLLGEIILVFDFWWALDNKDLNGVHVIYYKTYLKRGTNTFFFHCSFN